MPPESVVFELFLVFGGAAVLATLALFARQALIVAYIVLGVLLGPSLAGVIENPKFLEAISHLGIIFLLFLLGLNLHPQRLMSLFRRAFMVTLLSSLGFALAAALLAALFGFSGWALLVVSMSAMFSSTIIGLKLLPTSVLHHRHTGGVIISILLLQDILAILCLLLIRIRGSGEASDLEMILLVAGMPLLIGLAWTLQRYVMMPLLQRFDTIREYLFLLAIGWCLSFAELAEWLGLSAEIGAFVAGVSIATNPVSTYVAESLKPLRDFFLVLFFFALGASVDLSLIPALWWQACILAAVLLVLKPLLFRWLLVRAGETPERGEEVGVRLGQVSEFSLLISVLALGNGLIDEKVAFLVQLVTVLTFLVSPYLIVWRYPTPIAVSDKLRRD